MSFVLLVTWKKIGKKNFRHLAVSASIIFHSLLHIKRYCMLVNKSIYQLFWTRGICLPANVVHNNNDVISVFHPVFCTKCNKGVLLHDTNQNQTFYPNVIFNITSNDIVEKNQKSTEVARREPYYDKKRNISVNIFDKV